MKWLINFLRGTVTVVVTGADLERFLNRCAKAGLLFWAVDWREPFTVAITVTTRGVPNVKELGERCQCTVEEESRRGLPFFAVRFRKRYALIAGIILFLFAISLCSRFIFVIDIEGNETVSSAEILSQLRQHGVKPGVYGPSIDTGELSNEMLLHMEELSFFSLNLYGTRAQVIVREGEPKPELVDETKPTNVIATATGIVTHMEVLKGDILCQEGDTVMEGDVLISGLIDIQEADYSEADLGTSLVHAQGRVYARTWRTLKAVIPLQANVKELTGEEKNRFALHLLGKRVNFYRNGGISFSKYDKITSTKTWVLSDDSILPISLERETFREYELQETEVQEDAAENLLREQLQKTLRAYVGEEGEIIQEDYVTKKTNGFLEVSLLAECKEQIGKEVPYEEPVEPEEESGEPQAE